jgi:5'-3' exonuclease
MANYILVDGLNVFMRAKHAGGGKDIDMRIGMAMHIMFNSIKKAWNDFDGDHVVFCLEGRSWRKDFYPPYKKNRKVTAAKRSPREVEDDELFFESFQSAVDFISEKTNVSVIRHPECEGDDMIAAWIQSHPNDNHVIISTDSDFQQLLAPNVKQYDGVQDKVVSLEGIVSGKTGKPLKNKKTGEPLPLPDPKWLLFEKCVRGDTSDNIFSAYPGARMKGTKNKTGIIEAFEDRDRGGFAYNNFMLQRWVDHEEQEHRVRDDFERNKVLIDLTLQPEHIREGAFSVVQEAMEKSKVSNVGFSFMKFCSTWDLQRMSQNPTEYAEFLNAGIPRD